MLPITPLKKAISPEDKLIFLTKAPILPKISIAVMIFILACMFILQVLHGILDSNELIPGIYGKIHCQRSSPAHQEGCSSVSPLSA
jgi:hypothetical protein